MTYYSKFVYITNINTTPEKVWSAITKPELIRQYWKCENVSQWKQGSEWMRIAEDDRIMTTGEVLEVVPHELLVLTWIDPECSKNNAYVTFRIETIKNAVQLNFKYISMTPDYKISKDIKDDWERVLYKMKAFLEAKVWYC